MRNTPLFPIPPVGYKTQSSDTSIEAELVQFRLWRSLNLSKKASLVSGWTKGCWQMSLSAIRLRYPGATPARVRREFAILTLGVEIADLLDEPSREQTLMLTDPISLALDFVDILNRLGIPYLVGGSVASSLLGEPRSTQNIDLVADLQLEKVTFLVRALQPRFYVSEEVVREAIRDRQSFNIIDNESLGKVDIFILKDSPFEQSEFQRRQARVVRNHPERVLVLPEPEDIILQKLIWHRMGFGLEKQWRDIIGVMKLQGERLDFGYLWRWAETLELLESLSRAFAESGL